MSIEATYRKLLIADLIKTRLQEGRVLLASEVETEVRNLIDARDLSKPQFTASGYTTNKLDSSSAISFNKTFNVIRQDLQVLYNEMLDLSQSSIESAERWNTEAVTLERRLVRLEDRVEDMLLLAQDTEGFHSVIIDQFNDLSQVDTVLTTAEVDILAGLVTLKPNNTEGTATRIFLNSLIEADDVLFRVRNTAGLIGRTDAVNSSLVDPFRQDSRTWWTAVHMRKNVPVTCELTVRLSSGDPVALSKIFIELHDSVQSGPLTVTPLYSTDNVSYSQIPSNTYSQDVRGRTTFNFEEVKAKWIKFILTKVGPDPSASRNTFDFQFGFKNISFFREGFSKTTGGILMSAPLSVLGVDGNVQQFSKLTVETCERIDTGTTIDIDVTTSTDSSVPVTTSTLWTRITPVNRASRNHPVIFDVTDLDDKEVGVTETVTISYTGTATGDNINPANSFQLLSLDSSGDVVDSVVTTVSSRYRFVNSNDRILNYQIKDSDYTGTGQSKLPVNEGRLVIFRNLGIKGLTPFDVTNQVRGIQRGWGFKDPWYSCVVEIKNPEGFVLGDVGSSPIVIDGVKYIGTVDNTILTGKAKTSTGLHTIKVHKNNWKEVAINATTEADLKSKDSLYPYNHKLLVEGYLYDATYTDTKIYVGVDLFAEILMKNVSVFDFLYNARADRYNLYALDHDAPDTHTGTNDPTLVFLMKVDEENPDYANERYVIRFKLLDNLKTYLRLRATLSTEKETVSPALDAYKVKLG